MSVGGDDEPVLGTPVAMGYRMHVPVGTPTWSERGTPLTGTPNATPRSTRSRSSACSSLDAWGLHTAGPPWTFRRQAGRLSMHTKETVESVFDALYRQTHMGPELVRFEFGTGEQPVVAHRSILMLKSSVFAIMLANEQFQEARTGRVRIRDCPQKTFKMFVGYLYGQSSPDPSQDGRELWELADKYGVDSIKIMLLKTIDESNCAAAAQYAYEVDSSEIMRVARVVASERLDHVPIEGLDNVCTDVAKMLMVSHTRQGLPVFRFVEKWHRANGWKVPGETESLIKCIDFGKVHLCDIVEVVRHSCLLKPEQLKMVHTLKLERLRTHPWALQTIPPAFCFGAKGVDPCLFDSPVGISATPDGGFIIADRDNLRVQLFDASGRFTKQFNVVGDGEWEYCVPVGVAMSTGGMVVVADSAQHRVKIFDQEGAFVRAFGSEGVAPGCFRVPVDVAVNSRGEIAVCEYHNNRVQVFSSDGIFMMALGSEGGGLGQFRHPCGVAYTREDHMVVADQGNFRIQIFDSRCAYVRTFGKRGEGPQHFTLISSVAVSYFGDILVSDVGQNRVHIFTHDGSFAQNIGVPAPKDDEAKKKEANLPGTLSSPEGVAVTNRGIVAVVDGGNHRVQVFESLADFS
eukprot:CAMPEP_0206236986 /NCGR_PEP_ID=MMETSP0047_2-20121206/14009_1 /ASSEMBLY_ACC=CAM_ASM_000192 /TAXON_ID=195065 /ORGANISM="Chroomonas mesostigmatica_cf, Strain CCMP1168" /LENGTH=629 /DNA_ID=CAMNT_0053661361 /DNA_START=43 /DNA_END=1932 /DNA_ORIENTATION=-